MGRRYILPPHDIRVIDALNGDKLGTTEYEWHERQGGGTDTPTLRAATRECIAQARETRRALLDARRRAQRAV